MIMEGYSLQVLLFTDLLHLHCIDLFVCRLISNGLVGGSEPAISAMSCLDSDLKLFA